MNKVYYYILIVFFVTHIVSCDDDEESSTPKLPSSIVGNWAENDASGCDLTIVLQSTKMNWQEDCFGGAGESWEKAVIEVNTGKEFFRVSDSTYYNYHKEDDTLYLTKWRYNIEPSLSSNWWQSPGIRKWVLEKQ